MGGTELNSVFATPLRRLERDSHVLEGAPGDEEMRTLLESIIETLR